MSQTKSYAKALVSQATAKSMSVIEELKEDCKLLKGKVMMLEMKAVATEKEYETNKGAIIENRLAIICQLMFHEGAKKRTPRLEIDVVTER